MLPGSGRTSLLGSCLSTYNLRYSGLLGLSVFFLLGLEQVHVVVVCPLWTCAERPSNKVNTFLLPLFRTNPKKLKRKPKKSPKLFEQSWGVQECSKSWDKICEKFCSSPAMPLCSPSCGVAGFWNEILLSERFCKMCFGLFQWNPLNETNRNTFCRILVTAQSCSRANPHRNFFQPQRVLSFFLAKNFFLLHNRSQQGYLEFHC